jgi:predicted tellurium resistance membrane protein TerC
MRNVSALLSFDRQYFYNNLENDLSMTWSVAFSKDIHYTLFRAEDWAAWVTFSCVFACLIIFDNQVLNRNPKALTMGTAVAFTVFWVFVAFAFCGWVHWSLGPTPAFQWMSGYMLEWMLSFDNLFVFHMIFSVYGTPDQMKHKPLYLGICGAVFFRLVFIFIGEYLMHVMYFMHFIFGGFLVWTGVKTVTGDDEDEDPSQQPLVQWLQKLVPFVPLYDERAGFFVRVAVDEKGEAITSEIASQAEVNDQAAKPAERRRSWWPFARKNKNTEETTPLLNNSTNQAANENETEEDENGKRHYSTVDFQALLAKNTSCKKFETRATMLFLVVCCLEISDILFAVDSVSAIVAQVPDLFLAYTSAVFAMLGLRATFFIVDALVSLFSLLKYGVGAVLVFIGTKLIAAHWYHVPASVVCAVLVLCVGSSMVASVVQDKMEKAKEMSIA